MPRLHDDPLHKACDGMVGLSGRSGKHIECTVTKLKSSSNPEVDVTALDAANDSLSGCTGFLMMCYEPEKCESLTEL